MPIISVVNLSKTYASGFQALRNVNLDIRRGEIFALLGPNGAGKTTLISIICGIVTPTQGTVSVDGHDIITDYRAARSMIGLVPQELTTDAFETVWGTVSFSRGLFGKRDNPDHLAKVLKDLSLWDRRDSKLMTLSGGMKRRVLIAKALAEGLSLDGAGESLSIGAAGLFLRSLCGNPRFQISGELLRLGEVFSRFGLRMTEGRHADRGVACLPPASDRVYPDGADGCGCRFHHAFVPRRALRASSSANSASSGVSARSDRKIAWYGIVSPSFAAFQPRNSCEMRLIVLPLSPQFWVIT